MQDLETNSTVDDFYNNCFDCGETLISCKNGGMSCPDCDCTYCDKFEECMR